MVFEVEKVQPTDLNVSLHKLFEQHGVSEYVCTYNIPNSPDDGVDLTISCDAGYLKKVIHMLKQFYLKEEKEFYEQKKS